jgi:hypothetical protein
MSTSLLIAWKAPADIHIASDLYARFNSQIALI